MNRPILIGALAALTAVAAVAAGKKQSDPVLMTINGKPVTLSEFEYLYHKNNTQQLQPQTLDEYVDMFVTYKLKVADAEAAGIDTTAAFINELAGYRTDLASPYLVDKEYEDSLTRVAYDHQKEAVEVSHIMVELTDKSGNPAPQLALIDSLRQLVVNGADFGELARRYSIDPSARSNSGNLGYIVGGQYPYEFEEMAYDIPAGEISPVFDTRFGHHFLKPGARKTNPGEVHVRHILKVTRGESPEKAAAKKLAIDSIYTAVTAGGADFAETARRESEDPGSKGQGGELPWFSMGKMVPEFEAVAFALNDNGISQPFKSPFGWHIIQRLGMRPLPTYDQLKDDLRKGMERDVRGQRIADHLVAGYARLYPVKVNEATAAEIKKRLAVNGLDSATRADLAQCDLVAATVGDEEILVSDIIDAIGQRELKIGKTDKAYDLFLKQLTDNEVLSQARDNLASVNADYRNLLSEYRDGMLLYEISNRNVWNRASQDTAGLQSYFEANRDNYIWQRPHFKGYIVMASTDSVAALAGNYIKGRTYQSADSLNADLRRQFGRDAKAEFVVTAQGDNPIVDFVAFGGQRPAPVKGRRLNSWFGFNERIINAPEEAGDVRGAVSTDYQQELERRWVEELRDRYPVKINKKVLKKVK